LGLEVVDGDAPVRGVLDQLMYSFLFHSASMKGPVPREWSLRYRLPSGSSVVMFACSTLESMMPKWNWSAALRRR